MASRYSIACRCVGVHSRAQLMRTLRNAYCPTPVVEHVDFVADFKKFLNPSGNESFAGSPLKRFKGISLPLKFIIRKDIKDGVVRIRSKLRHTFKRWSDPWCPWKNGKSSGLSLEKLKDIQSVQFPLSEEELKKIRGGLNSSFERLNQAERED